MLMRIWRFVHLYQQQALLVGLLLLTGCAHQSQWPTLTQWRDSAITAASSPGTWAPLLAAGVVHATDRDETWSQSGHEQKPLYGSDAHANHAADEGKQVLELLAVGSALLAPVPADADWTRRLERAAVVLMARGAADGTTGWLKGEFDRERPNGKEKSLPSGHATEAFAYATAAARNGEDFGWSPSQQLWWDVTMYSIASSVAWARVEVQAHYPTDVLVGASVGHFFTSWLYDAYLKTNYPSAQLMLRPSHDGLWLEWRGSF
jgi:hypothetical protein